MNVGCFRAPLICLRCVPKVFTDCAFHLSPCISSKCPPASVHGGSWRASQDTLPWRVCPEVSLSVFLWAWLLCFPVHQRPSAPAPSLLAPLRSDFTSLEAHAARHAPAGTLTAARDLVLPPAGAGLAVGSSLQAQSWRP